MIPVFIGGAVNDEEPLAPCISAHFFVFSLFRIANVISSTIESKSIKNKTNHGDFRVSLINMAGPATKLTTLQT